ncbi:MAG: DUF1631 family protein [Alcanivoracaceae bacterium]|nr:DUF1631 family protein [Alcanivoracaceae bacterium]
MTGSPEDRLGKLFTGLYGLPREGQKLLSDDQLRAELVTVDPHGTDPVIAVQQRFPGVSLSTRQLGVVRLARQVLTDYFAQPLFHPDLAQQLLAASGALIAAALPVDSWLLRRSHPLHDLIRQVEQVAAGWYPGLPQAAQTAAVLTLWLSQYSEDGAEPSRWLEDMAARQQKIASRVGQSEAGALRLSYARQTSARLLNRQLAGRPLPDFIAEDIASHWSGAFQWALLHHGEDSPLWQKLVRSFGLLVWSLQREAGEQAQQEKLTRVISQMREELMPLIEQVIADEQVREQLTEKLEVAFLCQLHNRPMDYQEVPAVAGGNALDDAGASVSQDLLGEVAAVNIGDWFVEPASGRRLQLLLKLDEYQQLLFVNQLGMKQVSASFEEFAWQFSSAQISSVVAAVPLLDWSAERLNALAAQYRERQQAREAEHQAQVAEQLRIDEQRDQARRKAIKEARQLAADQQRREAEEAALRQSEAQLEQARRDSVAAEHGASEALRRQRARLLVSGLTMGVWLSFHDDDGVQTRRKLAVVLPSSGKYIFVDRIGTEKYEITRDALIGGIAGGAIEVVRKDSRFDDALNRVVDGIRQDRGWGNG